MEEYAKAEQINENASRFHLCDRKKIRETWRIYINAGSLSRSARCILILEAG